MKRVLLANIQWQMVRNSIWISLLTALFAVFILTYGEAEGLAVLVRKKLFGIPLLLVIPVIAIFIGGAFGYLAGDKVKKRLEILQQGTLSLERGNFSYRFPDLGADEVGLIGKQLNEMVKRVESQVISLQKLSTERAEWQETIKQSAINEERQRLARDLHDAVSQQLFAISMMTAALPHTLDKDIKKAAQQIEMVEQMASTAQSEMRALLLHLRPSHLEGKDLQEGIHELLVEIKTKHGLQIDAKIEKTNPIPKGIEDQLFRIVQEALSNILRHAKASRIEFQLRQIHDQLRLKIIDNGIGFEFSGQKMGSYGLQTMKERVTEIGGTLEIISIPNKGTQVEAMVPLVQL
ncbi:MAG: sensor histidine kinase [Bacillaceae bacterium]|nr:sensor histidine kinase [Bacillaceae bacterium]